MFPPAGPVLSGPRASRLRGFWSLTDQGLVSLGSFTLNIVLARALPAGEYGLFALVVGIVLFANSIHGSLITYPLLVSGAGAGREALRRTTGGSVLLTLVLALPLGALPAAAAWLLGRGDLAWLVFLGCVAWQVNETLRRALMADMRHERAIPGDLFSYLGQAGVLWALGRTGHLSLGSAFLALSACMAAGTLWHLALQGVSFPSWKEAGRQGAGFFELGRWVLLGNLSGIVSVQGFPWALALHGGPGFAASFQAAVNILGVANPVIFGVGSVIIPATAKARAEGGRSTAKRVGMAYAGNGALLVLPFYAALLVWPYQALHFLYGDASPYLGLAGVLRILVLAYVLSYFAQTAGAVLNGMKETRAAFAANAAAAAAAVAIGLPLAATGGLAWASAGLGVVNGVRAALSGWWLSRGWAPSAGADPVQVIS